MLIGSFQLASQLANDKGNVTKVKKAFILAIDN